MKSSLITALIFSLVYLFAGCDKEGSKPQTPEDIPGVKIGNAEYPSFSNSVWQQVAGGKAIIQFKLKDSNGEVTSIVTDSADIKTITSYTKNLAKGTYDISIYAENQTLVADTFARFNYEIQNKLVDKQVSFTVAPVITDGLITIGKSFIQDGTTPTFTPEGGTTPFKMGLINGFYYIYVKDSTNGTVSFTSKATQQEFTKKVNISSSTHYNLVLAINTASALEVIFDTFAYNEVGVESSTLVTIDSGFDNGQHDKYTIYYIVTNSKGQILNTTQFEKGIRTYKLVSDVPTSESRFNVFTVSVPLNTPDLVPTISGFLQVKKGSVWSSDGLSTSSKPGNPLKVTFKSDVAFDYLDFSTDFSSDYLAYDSKTDRDNISNSTYYYSEGSKLFVQARRGKKVLYNFLNISKGTTNFQIDPDSCTKTSLKKTFVAPGSGLYVTVYAIPDKNYNMNYNFGRKLSAGNTLDYYYPSEQFEQYRSHIGYSKNGISYLNAYVGDIPDIIEPFNVTYTGTGSSSSLANFKPDFTGNFDYYYAEFTDADRTKIVVSLYGPSAANYKDVKLPDFAKIQGLEFLNPSLIKLKGITIFKVNNFKEDKLYYSDYNSMYNIKSAFYPFN